MRRLFFSVLILSSLMVGLDACKKEAGPKGDTGAQGPAGPAGSPGPAGPAGPVGPAGAKGADGTLILTGAGAPTATTGANGNFYFDQTAKTLYGPKANGAWPAGTALAGAKGDKGDKGDPGTPGTPGTQFLSGTGAPTAATGNLGDYYYNTANSTFYGPKTADATNPWALNQFPLGTAGAARTYYLTRGLESVTPVANSRVNGQAVRYTWGPVEIGSSYFLNADDLFRISKYPGWSLNREMIFQTDPVGAPGVYDAVPATAAALGAAPFTVGAKFRYTQNFTNPTQEFTLTQEDIDRLQVNAGASFNYLTYAAVDQSVNLAQQAVGFRLQFHRTKHVEVYNLTNAEADASGQYHQAYQGKTTLNLNTIPGLMEKIESYKQDGKVYLKYRYVDPMNSEPRWEAGGTVGWTDATWYLNGYSEAGAKYGPGGVYTTTSSHGAAGLTVNPFAFGNALVWGTAALGIVPHTYSWGTTGAGLDQTLTAVNAAAPRNQIMRSGNFVFHWNITSGSNLGNTVIAVPFGPITLVNPNTDLNVVGNSLGSPAGSLGNWNYNITDLTKPYWTAGPATNVYYKAPNELTADVQDPITGTWTRPYAIPAANTVPQLRIENGKPASWFNGKPLVQVQVFVIPGDVVTAAAARGININDAAALERFANSIK